VSIKIVSEEVMNSSLHDVRVPDGTGWKKADREWEPGWYIVNQEWPGEPFDYLEGPLFGEAYARHRAVTVHGMTDPTAEPDTSPEETGQDDLPW